MKKLLTSLVIVLSLSTSAQSKKVDTIPNLTDTTKFISIADLNRLADTYKDKTSARAFENFNAVISGIVNELILEYRRKQEALKPKAK
jgi:hypothetical protein